jgi:hypothetical protein
MDRYEVVVVRYREPPRLVTWRDIPTQFVEVTTPMRNLVLPLATAWVRAFNQAELARPYGVWAIFRPQRDATMPAQVSKAPTADQSGR